MQRGDLVMLPKERPCDTCNHRKVCEARNRYDEIDIKITHPFFKVRVECSQFEPSKPRPRVIGG